MTNHGRQIRRHKKRTDDGKGQRRLIAGKRFRLPVGISSKEVDDRFLLIERLWRDNEEFCYRNLLEAEWTEIALWAADHMSKGVVKWQLPAIHSEKIVASHEMQARWSLEELARSKNQAAPDPLKWTPFFGPPA